jgi:hypothetical protein
MLLVLELCLKTASTFYFAIHFVQCAFLSENEVPFAILFQFLKSYGPN